MSTVYDRPGAASIRQAALWDAILELALGGGGDGGGGGVVSVNGKTGVVTLVASDVGALTQAQADGRYPLLTAPDPYPQYASDADVAAAVSAHAAAADPHPVYLTQAEASGLYSLSTHNHAGVYATPGDVSTAVSTHAAAADPHTGYLTPARGDLRYLPLSYTPPPPDLSNYWTKSQSDSRYLPINYTPPPTDLSDYWTKGEANSRFVDAAGDAVSGPLTVQGLLIALDPAPDNTLVWTAAGLKSTASGSGGGEDLATLHREEFESPAGSAVVLAGVPDTLLTVARNGVEQSNGGLHYSLAGSTLTFSDPFAAGERLVVTYAAGSAVAGTQAIDAYTKAETDALFTAHGAAADPHAGYATDQDLAGYALSSHNHDAAYAAAGHAHAGTYATPADVSSAVSTHAGLADPHGVYLLESAAFTQATADGRYLQLAAGGTVAGATSFTLRPTVAGVAQPRISVQSSAPSTPAAGDLWVW